MIRDVGVGILFWTIVSMPECLEVDAHRINSSVSTKAIKSYSHQNLYDFWYVNNGEYVVGKNGLVFRTSSILDATNTFNASLNQIDQMKKAVGTNYFPAWID